MKGYSFAGGPVEGLRGVYCISGGRATSCVHDSNVSIWCNCSRGRSSMTLKQSEKYQELGGKGSNDS